MAQPNIEWQNTIGGGATDWLYSIQPTDDGGYILGGSSDSDIGGDKTENSQGLHDYWVIKLDTTGVIQWQNTIGGSSIDNLYSIQHSNNGGYILGGRSISNISGDKTEDNQGGWDYWVVKLGADTVFGINKRHSFNHSQLKVYPNPTTGVFTVTGQGPVQVFDLLGNLVLRTENRKINLSAHPSGIYFVKVGERTEKLIHSR